MSLPPSLLDMPVELLSRVAAQLDAASLISFGQSCQLAHLTVEEPQHWKRLCLERNLHIRVDYWDYNWYKAYRTFIHGVPSKKDRLLVLDDNYQLQIWDGKLCSTDSLPDPLGTTMGGAQPTWSWDGRFIASAVAHQGRESFSFGIQVLDLTTLRCFRFPTPRMAFFISWHPDCTRLTYLSAVSQPMLAYIDILPIFEDSHSPTRGAAAHTAALRLTQCDDSSILLHEGQALYYNYCPIPGVDRILTNVPGTQLSIVGCNSEAAIPLNFKNTRPSVPNTPHVKREMPPEFGTKKLVSPDDSFPNASLGIFSSPCWTMCNTMVITLRVGTGPNTAESLVAFDGCWNPRYENRSVMETWRSEGVGGVRQLLVNHTMEDDTQDGSFLLHPQAPLIELFSSKDRISFLSSPNGRYILAYNSEQLVVVELVYQDTGASSADFATHGTYFSNFCPKRLEASRIVAKLPLQVIGAVFAPDNRTVLFLSRFNVMFQWNTFEVGSEMAPKISSYVPFVQAAFLMRHYLPFFPQYSQSMQMFSPDSTHFCYPADSKIWVQEVAKSGEALQPPKELCNGVYCAWSPR